MERSLDTYGPGSSLAVAVRDFCLADFHHPRKPSFPSVDAWQALLQHGTELWLDSGDIEVVAKLWCREFRALTTNNTLLNKEVQKGIYDQLVPRAASAIRAADPPIAQRHLVLEIAFVLNAVHGLELVKRFDAKVSVELHTDLAFDIEGSVAYGRRYHAICPSRFLVKVPLTPQGLVAARRLGDLGIPVNFTLGFSARQNLLIARAAKPAYCNVFMGRINALISDRGLGDGNNAGERATAASQRVVAELRAAGECGTRQIGASMRSWKQVPALAGLDVYTMPTAVAEGFLESGGAIGQGVVADFPVTFGVADPDRDGLHVFWDVDPGSQAAVDALVREDVAALDGDAVREILAARGGATYFPDFSDDETQSIRAGGKIPALDPWLEGVRAGRLAWDSLLTIAGLWSFAADQAKLDERIEQHL